MKNFILKGIFSFSALCLCIFLFFLWLILTTSGLKTIISILPHFIPGNLHINKAEGRLYDNFNLKNIKYRDNSLSFNLAEISINWQLYESLLRHNVFIKKLVLGGFNILSVSPAAKNSNDYFSLPSFLPSQWQIEQISLNNIAFQGYKIPNSTWQLESHIKSQRLQYKLAGNLLNGNINSYGEINFAPNLLWQIVLHVKNPFIQANASIGNITEALEGQWKIAIPNLTDIWAAAHGELNSEGKLKGTLQLPEIKAYFNAHHLSFSNSAQHIENLNGNIQGSLRHHWLNLTLQKDDLDLTLILNGNYYQKQWNGVLKKLNFNSPVIGKWGLKRSAEIQLNLEKYAIRHFIIANSHAFLSLDALWKKNEGGYLNETGKIYLPRLNITLNKFNLHAAGNTQQIQYNANTFSGGGQLSSQGKIILGNNLSFHAIIKGQNFLAINTPLYKAWVSPSLQLDKKNNQWMLKGNVMIPIAKVITPDYRQDTIVLPKETIIEDGKRMNGKTEQAMEFYSNVLLTLGEHVTVQAEGLSSQLKGQLRLQDAPNHPTVAQGELIIPQGKYKAYGQKLTIRNGRLLFNHNVITNPNLQIQASKQVTLMNPDTVNNENLNIPIFQMQKVQVGVQVTNTLEEPHVTLFSSPISLSQSDILSYILFEKPLDAISPLDAALLLRATSTTKMGTSGFEEVMKGIKNTAGFQKFSIESVHYLDPATASVKESTSLVLGKALSPKLYLSYSVGLMDPINILTIKYFLSKKWVLQSSSSQMGTGLDVFYTREKN